MVEYNKIETVFQRDEGKSKKLLDGVFRNIAVEYLANNAWEFTEKVDGTNIRVHWDGHKVEFGGRTDKAQIPAPLVNRLMELFGGDVNEQMFEQKFGENDVILFGEGYGAKIQNGGDYTWDGNSVNFILFDVMINGNYQPREVVSNIAYTLGIDLVPTVGCGTIAEAIAYVKSNPKSMLGERKHDMEGLVCRPIYELKDRCGNRIIVKIKWADMKDLV